MPAKFHSRPTWGPHDRKLSKEALVLQDYLGRCLTRTSEGLFPLALGYITVDTPLDEDEVLAAFTELSSAGLFDYDQDAEVVLDRTAMKTNPLRNGRDKNDEVKVDKRIPSAVRIFEALPDSRLKIEFVALADRFSPDLADAIREDSAYSYPSPLEGPSEDLGSTIEGAFREETSSHEESQSRGEVHQLEPRGSVRSASSGGEEW